MSEVNDLIIIGSGPAGLTASIYAARAGLSPLIITGTNFGGQLMNTNNVENFPGYSNITSGEKIINDLYEQTKKFGTRFTIENVVSINTEEKPFIINTKDKLYKTKAIIIATGSTPKWLNITEADNKILGLSTCATCDGFFYKDKEVIVVGGGNTAMEEALFLTNFVKKVTIIHRSNNYKASKYMLNLAKKNSKISWLENKKVTEWITDNNIIKGVKILDLQTECIDFITTDAVFIAIGHVVNTNFLKSSKVELDNDNYIIIDNNSMTNVPGVFACGDVCDKKYKQAVTASSSGCMAALNCEKWLSML
jgi:thioredoxin reductase (NADPH)